MALTSDKFIGIQVESTLATSSSFGIYKELKAITTIADVGGFTVYLVSDNGNGVFESVELDKALDKYDAL